MCPHRLTPPHPCGTVAPATFRCLPDSTGGRIGKPVQFRHVPNAVQGDATDTTPLTPVGKASAADEPKSEDRPEGFFAATWSGGLLFFPEGESHGKIHCVHPGHDLSRPEFP